MSQTAATSAPLPPGSEKPAPVHASLGASARSALLWGAGFTLVRDILSFATMIVLVRLLPPADYGSMAFAQAVIGLIYVGSFASFVQHVFQIRNCEEIDWQAHFTAGTIMNSVLFVLALAAAWFIARNEHYAPAALPIAVNALVFLLDVPAVQWQRMLMVRHDWARYRILMLAGGLVGTISGIGLGIMGAGIWALAIPPVLAPIPSIIDFGIASLWRPDWSWSWARYREAALFGINRAGSSFLTSFRQIVEQALLAGAFSFTILGIFTRAMGLATFLAGRMGPVIAQALYPVFTRSERASDQFRRFSGLILQCVIWTTLPSCALVAIAAPDIVILLYGPKWSDVADLLPYACAAIALGGIASAAYALLLANEERRACLQLDVISTLSAIALAVLLVKNGPRPYLAGLVAHGTAMLALTLVRLLGSNGIDRNGLHDAILPALAATTGAGLIAWYIVRDWSGDAPDMSRLLISSFVFTAVYLAILRFAFPRSLSTLIDVAPGRRFLNRLLRI